MTRPLTIGPTQGQEEAAVPEVEKQKLKQLCFVGRVAGAPYLYRISILTLPSIVFPWHPWSKQCANRTSWLVLNLANVDHLRDSHRTPVRFPLPKKKLTILPFLLSFIDYLLWSQMYVIYVCDINVFIKILAL